MMAYGTAVRDTRGFTANPAGLPGMRDWDVNAVTAIATPLAGHGFVFSGFGFGKRFLERHAFALQYSPGIALDIIEPATLVVVGLNLPADKTIAYAEPFAAAYALRLNDEWSFGLQARLRTERVNDPQYTFELRDSTITTTEKQATATTWFTDLAMLWKPAEQVAVGAVARGLARFSSSGFDSAFVRYALPKRRSLDVTVSYAPTPSLMVVAGGSTAKEGSLGIEWAAARNLTLRGGMTGNAEESRFLSAVAAGIGWSYAFLELDASYLAFMNQANRRGAVSAPAFDAGAIGDIAMSPYAANRLTLSVKAILGNLKESLARIEGVEMLGGIYPSAYEALAFRPVGKVKVRNISRKPIQARASFFVERFMDQPTETEAVYIPPGEDAEIPLSAVFNELVKAVPKTTVRDGTVAVSATVAEDYDDRTQTRVLIHGRNDWDGNALSLRYFVTPGDPEIIRYTRDILLEQRDSLEAGPKELAAFRNARILCDAFAGKLSYIADPKQTADYVQYPAETLKIRGGDCDDMTVCVASLLSSIGISTAFVDMVPPEQPGNAHIFLLFDTGVDPKFGPSVAGNPKRYVVRKGKSGAESLWIPIETTVLNRGFDEAWTAGAQQYFDYVEVGLGLIKGWVRIVDVY